MLTVMVGLLLVSAKFNQHKISEQRKSGRDASRRKSTDKGLFEGQLYHPIIPYYFSAAVVMIVMAK